jgi:hypothetical protein
MLPLGSTQGCWLLAREAMHMLFFTIIGKMTIVDKIHEQRTTLRCGDKNGGGLDERYAWAAEGEK